MGKWQSQPQELKPKKGLWREEEKQLVLLGGEQLVVGLSPSGLGCGVAGAEAEAWAAGEDQQEGKEGGGEPLGVQYGVKPTRKTSSNQT